MLNPHCLLCLVKHDFWNILMKDYPLGALPSARAPNQPLIALARKSLKSQNNQNYFSSHFL